MSKNYRKQGFTLVEMSFVFVIIGLLVAAVVATKQLINTTSYQAVISELDQHKRSVQNFRLKYGSWPGDMPNATDYWGQNTVCGGADANGTCNGDGNGLIDAGLGYQDMDMAWNHLSKAGFYSPELAIMGDPIDSTGWYINNNVPASSIKNGTYLISENPFAYYFLSASTRNVIEFKHYNNIGILKAKEAYYIDSKMDDGEPNNGKLYIVNQPGGSNLCVNGTSLVMDSDTDYCHLVYFIDE